MKRSRISKRGSKKLFTATALKTDRRNAVSLSRGGVRL